MSPAHAAEVALPPDKADTKDQKKRPRAQPDSSAPRSAGEFLRSELIEWARENPDGLTLGQWEMLEGFDILPADIGGEWFKRHAPAAAHMNAEWRKIPAAKQRRAAEARDRSLVRAPARRRMIVPVARRACSGGRRRAGVRRTASASRSTGGGSSGEPSDSDGPGERPRRDVVLLGGRDRLLCDSAARIGVPR
jgi:hypothetical protein